MIISKNMKAVAAALLVAAALAGCGSKNDPATGASSPTATAAGTTASVSKADALWANQLCSSMAAKVKPIQPPTVQASSPQDTKASLVTFFSAVIDHQGLQLQTLRTVGPPPAGEASATWAATRKDLKAIQKKIKKVRSGLSKASASDKRELAKLISKLGSQTKALASYGGPVTQLEADAAIGPALKAETACANQS